MCVIKKKFPDLISIYIFLREGPEIRLSMKAVNEQ